MQEDPPGVRVREGCGGRDQRVTGTERGVRQQKMCRDQGNIRWSGVRTILTDLTRDDQRITEGSVRDLEGDPKTVTETGRETVKN